MYVLDSGCCPFVLGIPLCITHGSLGTASQDQLQFCIQVFIKRLGLVLRTEDIAVLPLLGIT